MRYIILLVIFLLLTSCEEEKQKFMVVCGDGLRGVTYTGLLKEYLFAGEYCLMTEYETNRRVFEKDCIVTR